MGVLHFGPRGDVLERLLDRPQVAHAVVEHGDLGTRAHRSPFVDGMPVSVTSSTTARPSASAKALNAASTTWWSLPAASIRTCSVGLADDATARRNSSGTPASRSPTARGGKGIGRAACRERG